MSCDLPRPTAACFVALPVNPETIRSLRAGDRRTLARAITLAESKLPEHVLAAQTLLRELLPHTGNSLRIGVSGVPGAGKSTFIETFGLRAIAAGKRPAVLAVDPSSTVSGGSILGDKTRMQKLSNAPEAFIRPSPSSGELGGVARRTREAILLCEAAGHDLIIVETVGVGQSELEVASMTDFFLLLLLPNAGDELQGIKKGVLELADCFVVNKMDSAEEAALRTRSQFSSVLQFLHPRTPGWKIPVLLISALKSLGLEALDQSIQEFQQFVGDNQSNGLLAARRAGQNRDWMDRMVRDQILADFFGRPEVETLRKDLSQSVIRGDTTPVLAADRLIEAYFKAVRQ